MRLIVGLGNPGVKYEATRHNIGFDVIDGLANEMDITLDKKKFNAAYGTTMLGQQKVMLCKPLTFMNLSGEALRPLLDYYDFAIDELLVIYDDLDLPPGQLRLRQKGSAGGHNGIKSIIQQLGTEQFNRLRIGVGRPETRRSIVDHVLSRFKPDEQILIDEAIVRASKACEKWTEVSFLEVMNEFNS